ncbi:hypothetical protein [Methylobacterium sp. 1030]|uniref:hypothetical protein n=1 Tax=Methylobacterium sp. 1030 TaxID=3156404 RepID=UPI0033923B35
MADAQNTVIVSTGIAVTAAADDERGQRVEAAMVQAIRQCLDEGIIDPDVQRERILAARDAVLNG